MKPTPEILGNEIHNSLNEGYALYEETEAEIEMYEDAAKYLLDKFDINEKH